MLGSGVLYFLFLLYQKDIRELMFMNNSVIQDFYCNKRAESISGRDIMSVTSDVSMRSVIDTNLLRAIRSDLSSPVSFQCDKHISDCLYRDSAVKNERPPVTTSEGNNYSEINHSTFFIRPDDVTVTVLKGHVTSSSGCELATKLTSQNELPTSSVRSDVGASFLIIIFFYFQASGYYVLLLLHW